MRIVVIGGGAAGMGAAWGLTKNGHRVTLIEREPRLGGHLMSCDVTLPDGRVIPIDVGVSDFNRATFTNVGALFDELGLQYHPICQHASFMHPSGRTAWYSNDRGIHAVDPFIDEKAFIADIDRFRLQCVEVLEDPKARDETLSDYCDRREFSMEFRERYLYPRAQGSFPMPDTPPEIYPVRGLVAFWCIHGIAGLGPANRNVLMDGMASYGKAFAQWLEDRGGRVLENTPVIGVARRAEGIRIRFAPGGEGADEDIFDHAVFAVRGEQVLPLLEDASREEQELFGSLRWHRARVCVHRDRALMPDREAAWGAYNYVLSADGAPVIRPTITFYPAKLARLEGAEGIFVTMNPFREPSPDTVIANFFLSHPAAGRGGDLAAARIAQIQGVRNCWYCGSYLVQPWVHEPALATGVDLAEAMRKRIDSGDVRRMPHLDDFLLSIPLFSGLDPFAIADVRMTAERFSLSSGQRMFAQGDRADGVYLVVGGLVALNSRTPGDGVVELSRIGPGGVIGEFCLLDGGVRSAEARALEPTFGYRIDFARFSALRASVRPAAFEVLDRLRSEVARRMLTTLADIASAIGTSDTLRSFESHTPPPASESKDCIDLLATFPGFDTFDESDWREMSNLSTRTAAPRGTRLEAPGETVRALHIVARGALRSGLPMSTGVEQLLLHGPGAIAAAGGLVHASAWPLALDVREDAIVFSIARRDFARLRSAHSQLARKLFDMIGQQLTHDLRRLSRVRGRLASQASQTKGDV